MTRADLEREYAAATVDWAEAALELTDSEVATAVAAGRETVRRWRQRTGVPSSTHRRGLERLNQLRHVLENEFDSADAAQAWLHMPLAGFGGRTPLSLVTNGEVDAVIAALDTTTAGAFV
jgi:hypothetical protein